MVLKNQEDKKLTGLPVRGDFLSLQISTHAGIKIEVAVDPVWPPPSPPWAQIMSTPWSRAFWTCFGCPTIYSNGRARSATKFILLRQMPVGVTHVHDENTMLVQLVDHFFRRYANCTYKQLCLFFNNDIDQVVELALCIVVVCLSRIRPQGRDEQVDAEGWFGASATRPFSKGEGGKMEGKTNEDRAT